jgi:thiazole synthase
MAMAYKAAVDAGRTAYEIGLAPKRREAQATSPLMGFLEEK